MVLILDGYSEIGAQVRSDLGYLICLRHLFKSRTVTNLKESHIFLHTCAKCSELPSNISTMSFLFYALCYVISTFKIKERELSKDRIRGIYYAKYYGVNIN